MTDARYVRVEPNSQSFQSLENIITHNMFSPETLTREYLFIGFNNTLDRGGVLKRTRQTELPYNCFVTIEGIIEDIKATDWRLELFMEKIEVTINCGIDLIFKTIKMEKNEVYKGIDGELDYQQLRWVVRRDANGTPDETKPPAEWLSYIRKHVRLADDAIYNLDDAEAMAQFRKIAGLAVRAMMIHGCPERVIPEELLNQD